MAWQAKWDGKFLIGGNSQKLRLSPNFRLNEFMDANGNVRIHRELVASLQLLRDRFNASISVISVAPDGLGCTVAGKPLADLTKAAQTLQSLQIFSEVTPKNTDLHIRIHDPSQPLEVDLEQALMAAFSVTAAFETTGDPFQQITGNFDGAGLSFGPSQWNFWTGTLVPLLELFRQADEATLKQCFTTDEDTDDYDELLSVMQQSTNEQVAWGDSISTGRSKAQVIEPWRGYFQAVGRVQRFRSIMVEESLRIYGAKMLEEVKYLQSLAPHIQIDHLRCVCALYDLVIQQGSLHKAKPNIEAKVASNQPADQFALVRLAVIERGKKARKQYRSDTISRRLGILEGFPVRVTVSDIPSQRANIKFYMLRDVRIRNARELMTANVMEQLRRASAALAAGDSILVA